MSQSNNSSSASNTPNSWSTTVSRYVLQRRQQTHSAYQAQLATQVVEPKPSIDINSPNQSQSDNQDWLFAAIFELLVQRLEEGHTVLLLENTPAVANEPLTWQQQLLAPLLQSLWLPLAEVMDMPMPMVTLDELKVIESDNIKQADSAGLGQQKRLNTWHNAMRQAQLSQYDRQILQHRYDTYTKLQSYLSQLSQQNSLSKFKALIENHPLFQDNYVPNDLPINDENSQNLSPQNLDKPIIFQAKQDADHQTISITLWLQRTWQAEHALAQHIMRIKNQKVAELPITLNPILNSEQQDAIHMANRSAFSIITGGPGTGKTFTVAQLVIALQYAKAQDGAEAIANSNQANLALAAPTGKAAQRMQESLQNALQQAGVDMQLPDAKTIHRLLGIGQGGQPRYHADNPLSEDIIIVDEASMLGVELANHLVSAIKPKARLILLGDANQLAAVDAGAVLADLCRIPALQEVHKRLQSSRRFSAESGIGQLAQLINQDSDKQNSNQQNARDMTEVWQLMANDKALQFYHLSNTSVVIDDDTDSNNANNTIALNNSNQIKNSLSNYKFLNQLLKNYNPYISQNKNILAEIRKAKSMPINKYINYFNELMITLNQFKILSAGHHGRCGDHYINQYLSAAHKKQLQLPLSKSPWYHGRPVMILQNNYELGLFNGDIGICMQTDRGRLQVFFENKGQGIAINMLSDDMVATAYAMTIHKSQGSEFEHVAISFDDNHTRLLSQELIYTAVTRAKSQVSIYSTASAFTQALSTPTIRQTGLALQFSKFETIESIGTIYSKE